MLSSCSLMACLQRTHALHQWSSPGGAPRAARRLPLAAAAQAAAAASSSGGGGASSGSGGGGAPRLEGVPIEGFTVGGLPLLQQEFDVGGRRLCVVCPRDPDEVLDRYIESGADGDPYWTRVWPSAIALAAELLRRPQLVQGLRVADLGAGLGVAGIAAALAGAKEVVLLDREPLALECALMSARATGLDDVEELREASSSSSSSSSGGGSGSGGGGGANGGGQGGGRGAAADRLASHAAASSSGEHSSSGGGISSGTGGSAAPGARRGGRVSAAVFDWHQPPKLPRFDVVLACDVLYESDAVDPISQVVPQLLKSASGLLLLCDPPKRTAQNRERFLALLREGAAPFALGECYEYSCPVTQIDPELRGGVREETVPVQFHALRRVLGNDTVGLKAAPAPAAPTAP